MELSMREVSKMALSMVEASIHSWMERTMKVSGSTKRCRARENSSGAMVKSTKAIG